MTSRAAVARLAAAAALALAVAAAPQTAASASISVVTQRDGDTIEIHASAALKASAATAWSVLTDYGSYSRFIPDLRVSRVVSRDGARVTVEQSGDALFWRFRIPIDVTFEIDEAPPTRLQSHAVRGSLRALASSYLLTPTASGVRLDYAGRIASGFELLGRIEQTAVEENIDLQFRALAEEIERRSAANGEPVGAELH
jgi:ribosome-associated toxin RatA of RatAB toxin-antitoxin module